MDINDAILAIVVKEDKESKVGGGAPIFVAEDDEELEQMSMLISRLTMSMVHEISDGVRILIKH